MTRSKKPGVRYRGYFGQALNVTLVKRDKRKNVPSPELGEYTTSWLRRIGARETLHPTKRIVPADGFGNFIPSGVVEIWVMDAKDGHVQVATGPVPANIYRTFWVIAQDCNDVLKAFNA